MMLPLMDNSSYSGECALYCNFASYFVIDGGGILRLDFMVESGYKGKYFAGEVCLIIILLHYLE